MSDFHIEGVEIQNSSDKLVTIDNGAVKAEVNVGGFLSDYSEILPPEVLVKMSTAVLNFQREVQAEKAKGVHLGSTNLDSAVGSIFYEPDGKMDPKKYGLQTETELKLAAKAMSRYVKPLK